MARPSAKDNKTGHDRHADRQKTLGDPFDDMD